MGKASCPGQNVHQLPGAGAIARQATPSGSIGKNLHPSSQVNQSIRVTKGGEGYNLVSKPLIIELPNCQGIEPLAGEVIFRVHDSGQYLFPIGTRHSSSANFNCPNCGMPVRWLTNKQAAVFSCHCFIAVCGQPKHTVFIGKHLWAAWIEDFFRSAQEEQRSHCPGWLGVQ
jgi:hypothetical protein